MARSHLVFLEALKELVFRDVLHVLLEHVSSRLLSAGGHVKVNLSVCLSFVCLLVQVLASEAVDQILVSAESNDPH